MNCIDMSMPSENKQINYIAPFCLSRLPSEKRLKRKLFKSKDERPSIANSDMSLPTIGARAKP